jgi:hypothetical protein
MWVRHQFDPHRSGVPLLVFPAGGQDSGYGRVDGDVAALVGLGRPCGRLGADDGQ